MESCTALVLAGGRATRLGGVNKALVEVGGKMLLERVLDALRPLADQIVVVGHLADDARVPDVQVVPDLFQGGSTLVAIYSGLSVARNEVALVVGCDMPFLSTEVLARVARLSQDHDLAVPRVRGHLEALHAAYRRSCLPTMEMAIQRQQWKIIDFYPEVRVRLVEDWEVRDLDPDLRSFLNVNTPADLERARSLAGRG